MTRAAVTDWDLQIIEKGIRTLGKSPLVDLNHEDIISVFSILLRKLKVTEMQRLSMWMLSECNFPSFEKLLFLVPSLTRSKNHATVRKGKTQRLRGLLALDYELIAGTRRY